MILRADPGQLRPRLRAQGQEPHNLNVWDRLEPLSVLIAWICTILLFSARGRAKPIANAAPDKAARNALAYCALRIAAKRSQVRTSRSKTEEASSPAGAQMSRV